MPASRLAWAAILAVAIVGERPAAAQPDEFGGTLEEPGAPSDFEAQDIVAMSRRTQPVQEAPMIVTVITRDQIRSGGFRTMEDILRTIPGFEETTFQSGRFRQMLTRGQTRSLLFMMNGVPYYSFFYNTPYELDRTLDVQMIERIEVVSGAGGVLWGANALLGIVNVITREATQTWSAEGTIGAGHGPGERAALRGFARGSGPIGRLGRFQLMTSYFQTDGPEYRVTDSPFVNTGPFVWDQNITFFGNAGTTESDEADRFFNAMLDVHVGDFDLFGYVPYSRTENQIGPSGSLIAADSLDEDLPWHVRRLEPLFYLRFKKRGLDDRLGVQVTASLALHDLDNDPFVVHAPAPAVPATPPGGLAFESPDRLRRAGVAVEMDAQVFRSHQLVWGVEAYQDRGLERSRTVRPPPPTDTITNVPPFELDVFTGYLRDEVRIVPTLAIGAGLRYFGSDGVSPASSGRAVTPEVDPAVVGEASAVWNVTGRFYARATYAEGFRPPYLEACCSVPADGSFAGNPSLDVETSRSAEAELNWVTLEHVGPIRKLYLRLDYSYARLDGIIEQEAGQYFNRGAEDVHTVEVLARLDLRARSFASLSYFFVSAVDERSGPLRFPANHILNASFTYRLLPWLDVSSVLTAVGPREDINRIPDLRANQATMNSVFFDKLSPYYLLRAGLLVHDLPVPALRAFELRLFGDNILNQRYYTADATSTDKIEVVPVLRPGWAVFADLTARFGGDDREATP